MLEFCLDCERPLTGPYCAHCGQKRGPAVVPVRAMVEEAAADMFALDGRLRHTLRLLVGLPGQLTREYTAGRHTRFVAPLRLYLVISVGYFAVFYATGATRFFFIYAGGSNDPQFNAFVRLLPQLMFVLVPLFAAFTKAVSPARGRMYAEYLVFALHFHAFSFLVLPLDTALQSYSASVGAVTLPVIVASSLGGILELWIVVYLAISLRRVFGGSRLGAGLRSLLLLLIHTLVVALIAVLAVPSLRRAVWGGLNGG